MDMFQGKKEKDIKSQLCDVDEWMLEMFLFLKLWMYLGREMGHNCIGSFIKRKIYISKVTISRKK